MSPMLRQFGLDALSPGDRLALAQALWDSVHDALDETPIAPEVIVHPGFCKFPAARGGDRA